MNGNLVQSLGHSCNGIVPAGITITLSPSQQRAHHQAIRCQVGEVFLYIVVSFMPYRVPRTFLTGKGIVKSVFG